MPDELVPQKELFRRFVTNAPFEIRAKESGKARTLHFAASSEFPVERWYGMEVLSHDRAAVKLDRATQGAMPLCSPRAWG